MMNPPFPRLNFWVRNFKHKLEKKKKNIKLSTYKIITVV